MSRRRLRLHLVKPDPELSPEQIAALFTKLTGKPTTAQDLEDIKAELAKEDGDDE